MWNLNKVLIVPLTNVNRPFPIWVIPDNQCSDTVIDTVISNVPSRFVHVVPDTIVTPNSQSTLKIGIAIATLALPFRRKVGNSFVVLMVNAFEGFPVDNKRRPISGDACRQIIKPKIDSHCDRSINTQ